MRARYTFIGEGSNKEYNIVLEQAADNLWNVRASWGRLGTPSQTQLKNKRGPVSRASAETLFWQLDDERRNVKRYDRVFLEQDAPSAATATPVPPAGARERPPLPSVIDPSYRPMLLTAIDRHQADGLVRNSSYLLQPKWDGDRVLLFKTNGRVAGMSRNGLSVALTPEIVSVAEAQPGDNFVLDGEYCDQHIVVFDLLRYEGEDLRSLGCMARYEMLQTWFEHLEESIVVSPAAFTSEDKESMRQILWQRGAEGEVYKLKDASYRAGRGMDGLKRKFWATVSVLVTRHNEQRSVAVGLYDGRPLGNVTVYPNQEIPPIGSIVEVRYLYLHDVSGDLFQPKLLRVRTDIEASDCTGDDLQIKGVERE